MKAGIGCAEILFTMEMFPTPGRDSFTGIHDLPMAHVVLLEDKEQYALAILDLTDPGDWEQLRRDLAAEMNMPFEHILIHVSHVLSTPHCAKPHDITSEDIAKRDQLMRGAIRTALIKAGMQARIALQEVRIGIGYGTSMVNVNRVRETKDGYADATNEAGMTDHTVPVLCICNREGERIGVFYNVNTAAGVLEGSRSGDGGHLVSGDIASASARCLEKELGINAAYLLGASGDQWQSLRAVWDWIDAKGNLHCQDQGDIGFQFVELLGNRLAQSVLQTLPSVQFFPEPCSVRLYEKTVSLPGVQPLDRDKSREITRSIRFEPGEEKKVPIWILCVGEVAIICCQPELCVNTLQLIREQSPFRHTMLLEFVNGMDGYLVTEELYDKCTLQCRKGGFARGAAEQFATEVINFLREICK